MDRPARTIPDPGFGGDDGTVSAELAAAFAAYDGGRPSYLRVLATLQRERLLVPVVALLGDVGYDEDGREHEKTSDMATVLMQGRDGRVALLAFTSTATLNRWDPDARPVPAEPARVAAAALQDGACVIVVDVAGPTTFVVGADDVVALAEGFTLVPFGAQLAWARQEG